MFLQVAVRPDFGFMYIIILLVTKVRVSIIRIEEVFAD